MRILHLALALALLAPAGAATAQDQTEPMIEMARTMRANAEKMRGSLPDDQIAEMLKQADEIEEGARGGAYNAPPPPPPGLGARIAEAHDGRLDWLAKEAACAGYTQENWKTFRFQKGQESEMDRLCQTAYRNWFEWVRLSTQSDAISDPALAAYDKASQAAVDYYDRQQRR